MAMKMVVKGKDGCKMLLIGIMDGNIARMKEGKPFLAKKEQLEMLGLVQTEVAIFHYRDNKHLAEILKEYSLVDDGTSVEELAEAFNKSDKMLDKNKGEADANTECEGPVPDKRE